MIVFPVRDGISPSRILGMSGALIVHVGVFLFMAVPVRPDRHKASEPATVEVYWNDGKEFPPPPLPPPVKPQPIKPVVTQKPLVPTPVTPPVVVPSTTSSEPATTDFVSNDPQATEPAIVAPEMPASSYVGASVAAGYGGRPTAKYDHRLAREGVQGDVLLHVSLDANGHVIDVIIARSSGHRSLDQSAAKQVRRWTFNPAEENGKRVPAMVLVPMQFRLNRV
ncbi:hypothetical protein C7S18_01360 [Ahniella affigens]|uniref:TonB C-terminal domain-containing protein n=1 Tax=Ahniella affigens TaxID=2021234 RepID=A0A2P1PM65_9GAMM|nr:energy transducer TonB [Ahniella affigens]AVP95926.1 hypothetical protein C7S18_01360 [Ahniella affigens]